MRSCLNVLLKKVGLIDSKVLIVNIFNRIPFTSHGAQKQMCGIYNMYRGECLGSEQAQLGLPDKAHAIKELVVCNSWDLEPWDLLNVLALGCYQPSPEKNVWKIARKCKLELKMIVRQMQMYKKDLKNLSFIEHNKRVIIEI